MFQYEVPLRIDELRPGMVIAKTVSVVNDRGVNIVFARPNTRLTDRHIERLQNYNVKQIIVFSEEAKPEPNYIELMAKPKLEKLVPPVKAVLDKELQSAAVSSIRNLFDATREGQLDNLTTAYQVVKDLDTVVIRLVDTIRAESSGVVHINDIKSYDEYTYHHSLSVAVLSVAIGEAMGLGNLELRSLCRCALLHDIGKLWVPVEIITKPGRLERAEFEIVKQHAQNGGQYLKEGFIANTEVLLGVMFHHEKYNGGGYPKQLEKKEIPLFSRIIAVADVYDAVTSLRPYRDPMVPAKALDLIMADAGIAFDPDVVQAFGAKLDLYPINTVLELSDKSKGMVVNNANARRPIMKMLEGEELLDLSDTRYLSLAIVRVCGADELKQS